MVQTFVLAIAVVLIGIALTLTARGIQMGRLLRSLKRLRPTSISDVEPGLAMVHGRLKGHPLLKSPFQKRDCLYYYFRVLEPRDRGAHPRTLAQGKEWTLAIVEDGTGEARVDAVAAMVGSPRRGEWRLERLAQIPPDLADFFERAGIDEKHLPKFPTLVVQEYTIENGDPVYVTGTVRNDADGKLFYRRRRGPLVVSSELDVGYARGLRNELLIYAATPPLLLTVGFVLAVLAFS